MGALRVSRRACVALAVYFAQSVALGQQGEPPPIQWEPPRFPDYPEGGGLRRSEAPIKLPGSGGVTDTGAATYAMPLRVPDGTNGMQPELGLSYGGGYGSLGVGFALTGLSSISPCRKTLASDGEVDGVDFDETDAYCLDGAKLVYDAEGNEHWSPLAVSEPGDRVFRTELDTFHRVIAHDATDTSQPTSFDVHRPDGSKATYAPACALRLKGVSANAYPTNESSTNACGDEGKVAPVYLIDEVEDRFGNLIAYNYDINSDAIGSEFSYRISSIEYGFLDSTNWTRRIVFHYRQGRPDPIVRFMAGVKIVNRSYLTGIEAFAPNPHTVASVWRYDLQYEVSTTSNRLRLTRVSMADQFGVDSWTRRFDWTDSGAAIEDTVVSEQEFDVESIAYTEPEWQEFYLGNVDWLPSNDVRLMVYDADGDGLDDVLYRTHATRFEQNTKDYDIEGGWYVVESLFDYDRGRIRMRHSTEAAPLSEMEDLTETFEPTPQTYTFWGPDHWQAHLGKSRIADVDGNGRLDLLLAHTVVWDHPAANPPTGGDPVVNYYADLSDEWLFGYSMMGETPYSIATQQEIEEIIGGPVFRESSNSELYDYLLFTPPFQRVLADLDGDGLPDPVDAQAFVLAPIDITQGVWATQDWSEPTTQHPGTESAYHTLLSSALSAPDYDPNVPLAPFVFDEAGLSDSDHALWTCNNGNALVTDYEGDGRADVLVTTDTEVDPNIGAYGEYVRLRIDDPSEHGPGLTRASSTSELWGGDCGEHQPDLLLGDWNGDGLEDALYPPGSWQDNKDPYVRWNIGNGYTELQTLPVSDATLGARMQNTPPKGNDELPVAWDLGTRVVDLNHDGRSDIVAFRFDDDSVAVPKLDELGPKRGLKVIAYLSAGDHFNAQVLGTWEYNFMNLADGWTLSQVGDVDGDGSVELVHVVGDEVDFGTFQAMAGNLVVTQLPWRTRGDLLESVEDSGTEYPLEVFEYTTSWWGSGPRPEPVTCAYPQPCSPRGGFPVVRQHSVYVGAKADGGPRYLSELHAYADPRVDATGRGFIGFGYHRIWDRRLGAETMRWFDNTTRMDADDDVPGGLFYPYAAVPYQVRTIVPDAPLPTIDEIESGSNMPGLPDPIVESRIVDEAYEYELRWNGRRLTRLASAVERYERDAMASAEDLTQAVPYYASIDDIPDAERTTTTETTYDDYGNPTMRVVETDGGVERRVEMQYHDNPETWLLGQPSRVVRWSGDSLESSPARIVVTEYDTDDVPARVHVLAQAAGICGAQSCEELATTTDLTFDGDGNLVETRTTASGDPTPRVTHTYWDAHGVYPKGVRDPMGFLTVALRHPALGVPVVEVDANGVQTDRGYDGFGRLLTVYRPGTATTSLTYVDAGAYRGLEISAHAPDGLDVYAVTDDLGRTVERGREGFGGVWSYSEVEYDHFGNVVRESAPAYTLPALVDSEAEYDRLGRLLSRTAPDGGVTELVHTMFSTTSTDPGLHVTYSHRDVDGRVVETGHIVGNVPTDELAFTYGAFDQVELVVDALGNETSIVYDPFGRVVERTDPDRGTTTTELDGFGQVRLETRANGETIEREYDVLGRLVEQSGSDWTETWDYDGGPGAAHRLTSATSADDVLTEIEYDALGRKREIRQTIDTTTHSVVHQYDNYGRLKYLYYPEAEGFDRFTTYYSYGSEGLLSSIGDATKCNPGVDGDPNAPLPYFCTPSELWTVLARDERFVLKDVELGDGQIVQRTYDEETGQLRQLSAPGRITNFLYDLDGHVIERNEQMGGRVETFQYDDLHRLWNWKLVGPRKRDGGPPTEAIETIYEYSELGDLMRVTKDGSEIFEAVLADGRAHALESTTIDGLFDDSHAYDEVGRQIEGGGRTTTWNHHDLPISMETAADTRAFRYDAMGTRVWAEDAEATITYMGELFEHRDGIDGVRNVYYVHGEPALVAQVDYADDGETTRYVISDSLDSATTVVTGAATEQAYFDPFGGRVNAWGDATADDDDDTSFGFTGHEEDGDGLINMGGRIYDRMQYRFLTPDPIIAEPLFGQAYNPYSYVLNNPTNLVDPTGYQVQKADDWETFEEEPPHEGEVKTTSGPTTVRRWCAEGETCAPGPTLEPSESSDDDQSSEQQSVYRMGDYILDDASAADHGDTSFAQMHAQIRQFADDQRRASGEGGAPSTGDVLDAYSSVFDLGDAQWTQMNVIREGNMYAQASAAALNTPDFLVVSGGYGPFCPAVTVDWHGQVTLGVPVELSTDLVEMLTKGKMGLGGGLAFGYYAQPTTPDAEDNSSFQTGYSTVVEGGYVVGLGFVHANGRSAEKAVLLGLRTPGMSAGGSYGIDITEYVVHSLKTLRLLAGARF